MRVDRLTKVEAEIERLKEVIKEFKNDEYFEVCSHNKNIYTNNPKHTGAIKRASMDLTRALSNLRRSDWTS